jgi:Immunity protein Imm1
MSCGVPCAVVAEHQMTEQHQPRRVGSALASKSGLPVIAAGRGAFFYVWNRPVIDVGPNDGPREHLRVGFFANFGAAMFNVDPREPGDYTPTGQDWAWLALRPEPIADPPTVYFEQESRVEFPPRCIMPIDELTELVYEYVETGKRPTSVEWLTVNALYWELDGAGDIAEDGTY